MKVENIKLKSCPFCGGEADFLSTDGPVVLWCTQCGMESDGFETEEKAASWWNTRAGEPTLCIDCTSYIRINIPRGRGLCRILGKQCKDTDYCSMGQHVGGEAK